MWQITFKQENGGDVKVPAVPGQSVLQAALQAGVYIDAPCSGSGTCGKCRVKIISGTLESQKNPHLSEQDFDEGWRLACVSTISGDAAVLLPAQNSGSIRTVGLSSAAELDRYSAAVSAVFASGLPRGVSEKGVGLAVDIGTTTVSAALVDLQSGRVLSAAGAGNAQTRYGADVIHRIIQSSKPGGAARLRDAVLEETLLPVIRELCREASIRPENITRAVIAGNTTMQHLLVGADAQSIRVEPYTPAFLELTGQTAESVGLPISPGAPVVFAPNVGSYVGGDITAGVLASMLWDSDEMTLFVDLGTNGELVLGNRDFMLCCACSAGPAFEGGDITCGMRAMPGAIESVKIEPDTMEPALWVIGGGQPSGICGSGLIDTVSELLRCGIIDARGKISREGPRIRRTEYEASYLLAFGSEAASGREIELTETDIDNFIRAKGAVFSAIQTMLSSLDLSMHDIGKVLIAGGIGSGINITNAISIGMLPPLPKSRYSYIGNSCLTGAAIILQSQAAQQRVFELGHNMTYLELSSHPGYMNEFIAACFLPHTNADLFEIGERCDRD